MSKMPPFDRDYLFTSGVKVLLAIGKEDILNKYRVAVKSDVSWSASNKYIDTFEKMGLVELDKKSQREHIVSLTDKGKEIKKCLENISKLLEKKR
jgi:predicted transcriptional regulator